MTEIVTGKGRHSFAEAYRLQSEGRFHRAANEYIALLKAGEATASTYNNLGNCFRSLGRYDDSIRAYARALTLDPDRASTRLNRSLARLSLGDYAGGWQDYESRLEAIPFRQELLRFAPERQWKGERPGPTETLYLFGNQGLGDELQCLRFLSAVAPLWNRVVLEVQAPMLSLCQGLPESVEVIVRGDPVPAFHHWCEWFSLPGILGIRPDSIPAPVRPRFEKNETVLRRIRKSSPRDVGSLKVGLVWSGNPANSLNRFRACSLETYAPLFSLPQCEFFSLQKGTPTSDLGGCGFPIHDLGPDLTNFAATATAMDALDLVITTDTSIPHLAGTLGTECWVLLHDPADWRWGREGATTPWYPSLRLFRQGRAGDWSRPVKEIVAELELYQGLSR